MHFLPRLYIFVPRSRSMCLGMQVQVHWGIWRLLENIYATAMSLFILLPTSQKPSPSFSVHKGLHHEPLEGLDDNG